MPLATDEGHFWKLLHQVEYGAHRGDALVEALATIPEPDRIEVGVTDKVCGPFHELLSTETTPWQPMS